MQAILDREFARWSQAPDRYLELPADLFCMQCPPMLCIGGQSLEKERRGLLIVSLEPLKDPRTFEKQLNFIEHHGIESYRQWQLSFFSVFPELIAPRSSTAYWGDMGALVRGWAGEPEAETPPWKVLSDTFIEVPLIPMHARTHTQLGVLPLAAQVAVRLLFRERLQRALDTFQPAALLALGVDAANETLAALQISETQGTVSLLPYEPTFGRARARYERAIEIAVSPGASKLVFLRRAPITNWHRPNRAGIYAIGASLRRALTNRELA
jgi:hypothetical protein